MICSSLPLFAFFCVCLQLTSSALCGRVLFTATWFKDKSNTCKLQITVSTKANFWFTKTIEAVYTGGYFSNPDTRILQTVATPGKSSKADTSRKTASDVFFLSPDTGTIKLGFPYIRFSRKTSHGQFCYGSLAAVLFNIISNCKPRKRMFYTSLFTISGHNIVFAIDSTGSMSSNIRKITAATFTIFAAFKKHLSYRVAFVDYNDPKVELIQDFSSSSTEFKKQLKNWEPSEVVISESTSFLEFKLRWIWLGDLQLPVESLSSEIHLERTLKAEVG